MQGFSELRSCRTVRRSSGLFFCGVLCLLLAIPYVASAQSAPVVTTTQLTVLSGGSATGSVQANTPVTLQATVIAANNTQVIPGQVIFCDASNDKVSKGIMADCVVPIATAQTKGHTEQTGNGPTSYGQASITIYPAAGNRRYEAVFLGNSHYKISSNTTTLTVTGAAATTTSLAVSGSSPNYSLTATVNTPGFSAATGSVDFNDTTTGASLGSVALSQATAVSSLAITSQPQSSDNGACSITSGDFNNDGIADFAVGVGDCVGPDGSKSVAALQILLGKGDGTFTSGTSLFQNNNVTAVTAGDYNNDGFVDLIADADNRYFLAGNGNGSFSATSLGNSCGSVNMLTADFNGDGNLDFAVNCPSTQNNSAGATQIYLGGGNGSFTAGASVPAGGYTLNAFGSADFNSDGFPDLVIGSADFSSIAVYLNDGTGSFQAGTSFPVPSSGIALAVGDFNGDGNADVVIDSEEQVEPGAPDISLLTLEPGNGNGTFGQPVATNITGVQSNTDGFSMVAADFNGDGITDLGMISGNNTAPDVGSVLALGSASGSFRISASVLTQETGDPDYFPGAVGDFNKDGIPDILISSSDMTTAYAIAVGQNFTQTATLSPVNPIGAGTHNVTASYGGDTMTTASTSAAISLTAASAATTLALAAAPTSATFGSQVVLTATLTPYASGQLTTDNEPNNIVFLNGNQAIGTATLKTGLATLNLTSLPVGANSITARYTGDANFAASTSSAVTVTISQSANLPTAPTLTPSSLTFSGTTVGSTSAAQSITVRNTGTVALNISSIAASANFAQTNTCGNSLAAGASCTVSVTFSPASTGSLTGTLTITDNAASQTQTVALSGTGTAASIGITATNVPAGGFTISTSGTTAILLSITPPSGYTGSIPVTCHVTSKSTGTVSNTPTCIVNPSTVNATGGGALTTSLTITTGGQSAQLEHFNRSSGIALAGLLLGVCFIPRRRWNGALLAILCTFILGFAAGCGGSSNNNPSSPGGTTSGNYTVTITATAGSATGSADLPFIVQ